MRFRSIVTLDRLARMGEEFFLTLGIVELIAVLVLAPALTAGALCLDKDRGSLALLFVTDLFSGEIVRGKLGTACLGLFGLLLVGLPVMALVLAGLVAWRARGVVLRHTHDRDHAEHPAPIRSACRSLGRVR